MNHTSLGASEEQFIDRPSDLRDSHDGATSPRRSRLCFVTQWFPPEPVTVPFWVAQSLSNRGWSVRVLTGVPNFPDGKVHAGFSAFRTRRDSVEGMSVLRTPLYPSHDASALRRLLNYASWAVTASVRGSSEIRAADVALVYSSPATAALPAMMARALFRTPYVLLIQDIWPDSVFASGFLTKGAAFRLARGGLNIFTQLAYAHASRIAVISPGMRDLLVGRGVASEKIVLVYNWVDELVYRPVEPDMTLRESLGIPRDDLLVMYAGNHGGAQDLSNIVRAAGRLRSADRIHLVFVGGGVEKDSLVRLAKSVAPDVVHFLDRRAPSEMAQVLAAADFCLVSLKDDPLFSVTMPGKVQALLASGRPIIVSAPGDSARVVDVAGAGYVADPGDPESLARTLRRAAGTTRAEREAMGERGLHYYMNQMSSEIGSKRLADLLVDATASSKGR